MSNETIPEKLQSPSSEEYAIETYVMPLLNAQTAPVVYLLKRVIEVWNLVSKTGAIKT